MRHIEKVCKALEYIENHLNDPIDFEILARVFHFSPYYFHRVFSMVTGKTITAHIRDRRLERACLQLYETNKTIIEICFDCGFNSPSVFCRIFKQKYGFPPSEYRRQKYIPVVLPVYEIISRFKQRLTGGAFMNKFKTMIAELSEKIESDPKNAELYHERGDCYGWLYKREEAIQDFTTAIELEPANADYYRHRAYQYAYLRADPEKAEKAIADFNKAIELEPENPEGHGGLYYTLEKYTEAKTEFLRVKELKPKEAVAYNNLGNVCQWLGNHDEAVIWHTKALELETSNHDFYYCRATSYSHLKEYEKALEDYIKVIELEPDNAEYYLYRAFVYQCLENYEKAFEDFTKAIELDPDNPEYYFYRGSMDGGVEDFTKAIELDSDNEKYYLCRGNAYRWKKQYREAIQDYTKAIELDPTNPASYLGRAFCYYSTEKIEEAIAECNKTIELADPPVYYWSAYYYADRAYFYSLIKKHENAIQDYTKAIELDPTNAKYYFSKSEVHRALEEYEKARADIAKAFELDPQNKEYAEWNGALFLKIEVGKYYTSFGSEEKVSEFWDTFTEKIMNLRKKLKENNGTNLPLIDFSDNPNIPETEILIKTDGVIAWRKDFFGTNPDACAEEVNNMIEKLYLDIKEYL
jgi:tetratricopeptide (TPR) repeat protein/AraC-like DNA-binding protein